MIRSELIQKIADENPHLTQRHVERIVNTVFEQIIEALARGEQPKAGTQEPGRHTVEPLGGPTSLVAMMSENHDYRPEWGA